MGKKLLGLCAAMTMLAAGGVYAQQEPPPQAGAMEEMHRGELTGKVVKADQKMVYVDYMGAIVPLKIESSTKFVDPQLKRAADLKEGQEIRASFKVDKKTNNVAETISLEKKGGMGGTGEPTEPTEPSQPSQPSQPGE